MLKNQLPCYELIINGRTKFVFFAGFFLFNEQMARTDY